MSASEEGGAAVTVKILTRPCCHLCDEMKGAVEAYRMWYGFEIVTVDVTTDAELEREHGMSVPVAYVDGRLACKGRLEPARFARILDEAGAGRPRD